MMKSHLSFIILKMICGPLSSINIRYPATAVKSDILVLVVSGWCFSVVNLSLIRRIVKFVANCVSPMGKNIYYCKCSDRVCMTSECNICSYQYQ